MLKISKDQRTMNDRLRGQFENIHANLKGVGIEKGITPLISFLKVLSVDRTLTREFEQEALGYPYREKSKIDAESLDKMKGLENALSVFDAYSDVEIRRLFIRTSTILKITPLEKLLFARNEHPEKVEGILLELKRAEEAINY